MEAYTSQGYKMKKLMYQTLVVGSGCAGLNALDSLSNEGVNSIALITEGLDKGTSRNTGSDKQTYYKLSIAGNRADSVQKMADTLGAAGEIDKSICYTEAANSTLCFFKLANLGVKFPTNNYGEYVCYQTDHDTEKRATSAGPLTSKQMWQSLLHTVIKKELPILDGYTVIKLIKDKNLICGVVAIKENELTYIECSNLILATGGPSGIYHDSVYPISQHGMSSLALIAGVRAVNLQHWQYGIASIKFRWNLSGTYQQVIPRYISIDTEGNEHEFLLDSGLSLSQIYTNEFLKGYQWPFDSKKADGSSKIDILVQEQTLKNRKVYLDYTKNPKEFSFSLLSKEAYDYLEKSNALQETPYKRLQSMNPLAIDLYNSHFIDLSKDLLEIKVCAQNHNGGILVNNNWQTDIENLFVVGEAAGTFGAYRPGGTALNSTQVSSLRAAKKIAQTPHTSIPQVEKPENLILFEKLISTIQSHPQIEPQISLIELLHTYQIQMSKYASFYRNYDKMCTIKKELDLIIKNYFNLYGNSNISILDTFTTYDIFIEMQAVLSAMIFAAKHIGSYGGAITTQHNVPITLKNFNPEQQVVTTTDGSSFNKIEPFAKKEDWFESVWNEYRLTHTNDKNI
jgi:succinate dehydrogenase/fumarate reductase flavoprotein subunit